MSSRFYRTSDTLSMISGVRSYARTAWSAALTLLALVSLAACTFDGSALDARPPCNVDSDCASGRCVAGSCAAGSVDDTGTTTDVPTSDVDTGPDARICDPGEARCLDQFAERCSDDGTELVRTNCSIPTSCNSTQPCACTDGTCVARSCSPGTRVCSGDDVVACDAEGLDFEVVTTCESGQVCIGGGCVEASCEPGSVFCAGESLVECSDAGRPVERENCAANDAFCDETMSEVAICIDRVCEPGSTRCADEITGVETCNPRGSAYDAPDVCGAEEFCQDGACQDGICDPGTIRCDGAFAIATCDEVGGSVTTSACGAAQYCTTELGAPRCVDQLCTPGRYRCVDDESREQCNAAGSAYGSRQSCAATEVCFDGACGELLCEPGFVQCAAIATAEICNEVGTGVTEVACGAAEYCSDELGGCQERICTPGATICGDDGVRQRCNEAGSAFTPNPCEGDDACVAGECREVVCTPGTTCRPDASGRNICNESGTTLTTNLCPDSTVCFDDGAECRAPVCAPSSLFCGGPDGDEVIRCNTVGTGSEATVETCDFRCVEGACQGPICGDGIVTPENGEQCDDGNTMACDGCEDCQAIRNFRIQGGTGVDRASSPRWFPNGSDVTLELWVRPVNNGAVNGALVGIGSVDQDYIYIGLDADTRPFGEMSLNAGAASPSIRATADVSIRGTNWSHIAVVRYENTAIRIYVNGRFAGEASRRDIPDRLINDNGGAGYGIWIGDEGTIGNRAGTIVNEFRISETQMYTAPFTPQRFLRDDLASVRAHYRFNEGGGTQLLDASGNNRHLTLTDTGSSWVDDSCYGAATSFRCGDGNRAAWEQCDDGNTTNGDGCSDRCELELPACSGARGPNGQCYFLSPTAHNWSNARDYCRDNGAELMTVRNFAEHVVALREVVIPDAPANEAWIGLRRANGGAPFVWLTDDPLDYTAWHGGGPVTTGTGRHCVRYDQSGSVVGWNNVGCTNTHRALCERRDFPEE